MGKQSTISEKWLKASILGTTWAASEIVFGSFLHNLRVPFSGNILTAVGLVIMISASYKWKERGLFWRAGLICALMKSMSPSAIIFGPMVAIFTESLLLEGSVRLLGRTWAGFVVGSVLAMSWTLIQKILNLLLFYGAGLIDVYYNLLHMAEKQLNIQTDMSWAPLYLLLVIEIILGVVSATIGIRAGHSLQKNTKLWTEEEVKFKGRIPSKNKKHDFSYSLWWLLLNFILIIGLLVLINLSSIWIWPLAVLLVAAIWVQRYKNALRRLYKPGFWVTFIAISMLSALAFSNMQGSSNPWAHGLITGLQMNFRAVVIILGFAALGRELYNPKIYSYFQKSSYRQFYLALELAFDSIPQVIAQLPVAKKFFQDPLMSIRRVIALSEIQLERFQASLNRQARFFFLTGDIAEGKSTKLKEIATTLQEKGMEVYGFYAERILNNGITEGYQAVNIRTSVKYAYMHLGTFDHTENVGRFHLVEKPFKEALDSIQPEHVPSDALVVIDEIGNLELKDRGWSFGIKRLMENNHPYFLMVCRKNIVHSFVHKWFIKNFKVYHLNEHQASDIAQDILNQITDSAPNNFQQHSKTQINYE